MLIPSTQEKNFKLSESNLGLKTTKPQPTAIRKESMSMH